jgi:hypothetical protein
MGRRARSGRSNRQTQPLRPDQKKYGDAETLLVRGYEGLLVRGWDVCRSLFTLKGPGQEGTTGPSAALGKKGKPRARASKVGRAVVGCPGRQKRSAHRARSAGPIGLKQPINVCSGRPQGQWGAKASGCLPLATDLLNCSTKRTRIVPLASGPPSRPSGPCRPLGAANRPGAGSPDLAYPSPLLRWTSCHGAANLSGAGTRRSSLAHGTGVGPGQGRDSGCHWATPG